MANASTDQCRRDEMRRAENSAMPRKAVKGKKARPLPPGQRLVRYAALSAILVLALHGGSLPVGGKLATRIGGGAEAQTLAPPINLRYPLDLLQAKLQQASALKDLRAGVFVSDQSTGRYVDLNGREGFPAASMIKVPVFVSLLTAIDQGQIKPDQMLEIRQDLITGGSGWLQWRAVGSKISVKDTAELMITISDNTATNMLIDVLGGKEALNREYVEWGMTQTRINNWLGDFEGTNTTSPYDLVYLMARIDRGEVLSADSRQWMYHTMERTRIRTLLPQGLAPGARIAHKTGDIAKMVGDAGIVTTPGGRKYFVSIQVERPRNDRRANLLIRSLSKMIYETFSSDTEDGSSVVVVAPDVMQPAPSSAPHHHRARRHHRRV